MNKILKKIRYVLEAFAARSGLFLFQMMGLKNAANFASFLTSLIGKKHKTHNLARRNIKESFPDLSSEKVENILDSMWDNLGRIIGEFIFVSKFTPEDLNKYVSMHQETKDNISKIKDNAAKTKKGGIIFSAHTGNWEIGPKILIQNGIIVKTVYRPLNNEAVDKMTSQIRGVDMIPKSTKGNKQIIAEVKKGNFVVIMADQKISDGILAPFFGRNAKTTASIAKLALKYDIPLIPARSIRIGKEFKFEVRVEKPLEIDDKKIGSDAVTRLTIKINQKLEEWITQFPEQWFWVHDRWKK
ncbi:MAG: KDO2-lipid IV(A) lauroyltransferase [Rickettsiales bacterium]|jgi:KDO2-lipid IV(A) lauroyltransferase